MKYLLARGQIGRAENERILRTVLAGSRDPHRARPKGQQRRWILAGGLALVAVAAAVVLWVGAPGNRAAFTAKGGDGPDQAVALTCAGASLEACPRGSTLVFSVAGSATPAFVSAYAEPALGGERIWYLDHEAVAQRPAPPPGAISTRQVLPRGARVGLEHTAARYSVYVVIAAQPLSRAEAIAAAPPAGAARIRFQLQVTAP